MSLMYSSLEEPITHTFKEYQMSELKNMTKEELIAEIANLKEKLSIKVSNLNRKDVVLGLIKDGFDTADAIGEELSITKKNVASILTALRKEGNHIITMKVGGNNIIKLLSDDEAKAFGLA